MPKRVGVAGSRGWCDIELEWAHLNRLLEKYPDMHLVSGGAEGGDFFAEAWAFFTAEPRLEISRIHIILPEWSKYGKSAGMIRNTAIVEGSDMIVSFWDGKSRGTLDTMTKALAAGKPVWVVREDGTHYRFKL